MLHFCSGSILIFKFLNDNDRPEQKWSILKFNLSVLLFWPGTFKSILGTPYNCFPCQNKFLMCLLEAYFLCVYKTFYLNNITSHFDILSFWSCAIINIVVRCWVSRISLCWYKCSLLGHSKGNSLFCTSVNSQCGNVKTKKQSPAEGKGVINSENSRSVVIKVWPNTRDLNMSDYV